VAIYAIAHLFRPRKSAGSTHANSVPREAESFEERQIKLTQFV
jgi:hypothetical protein